MMPPAFLPRLARTETMLRLRHHARRLRPLPPRGWPRRGAWHLVQASGLFDAEWYAQAYPDVPRGGARPLWHYATRGAAQGRDPNPMFRTSWYLSTYPDVAGSGTNPLVHYLAAGAAEGRDPGPDFDTDWYLASHPDVARDALNPLGHYLGHGIREGRRPRPTADARTGVRRVVVVSGEPDSPGHRYRVADLAGAVRAGGGRCTVLTLPEAASTRTADVDDADVVVLWRTSFGPEVDRVVLRARRADAVLVFDVDDLMVDPAMAVTEVVDGIRSQELTEPEVAHWFRLMRETAELADVCTCTTPELARHLRTVGHPVHVVDNGYDEVTLTRSRLAARTVTSTGDDLVRIGYASGSRTHQRDFAVAAEAVAAVLRARPRCRLVAYRGTLELDEFPVLDDVRHQVEWRDLVPHEQLPFELARYDVNLAPLEVGNPFCEAKSPLKFFEAALVDVPTVASPTGPLRRAIDDGRTGLLATGTDAWHEALLDLVDDADRRTAMGRAARRSVLWPFGPERRALRVRAVLDQVCDDGAVAAAAFRSEVSRRDPAPPTSPALPEHHRVVAFTDRLRSARVTVVVPVHDYADYLQEALDSVAAQTLDALDLVIVDDASTDASLEVARAWLAEHAGRFTRTVLLSVPTNAGLARARNLGFDHADTPFVLPLDADNALLPECAAALLDALDSSGAAFAYPRIRHVGEDSALFPSDHVRGYLPYAPQRLVPSNYIDAMALVSTAAWTGVGGYRDGLSGWEDYDLWCRFAELGLFGRQVDAELARYRVHSRSMLHTVTHADDRLADVRRAMVEAHPWLHLEDDMPAAAPPGPAAVPVPRRPASTAAVTAHRPRVAPTTLSERARELLPVLRCPETAEPLEEADDGCLRSLPSGRRWPVVAGRPVLFPGMTTPVVHPPEHRGNPLPERARALVAEARGVVLHLSGGGTAAGHGAVELDAGVYGATDVVGDAHHLPFADGAVALVVAMNAFEHYREPTVVAREVRRVLRPGGLVLVHTAFLQPLHEAPHHYYNCTRYGLEEWFRDFDAVDLRVSDNFGPLHALGWLASDTLELLGDDVAPAAAAAFAETDVDALARYWRDPRCREDFRWAPFAALPAASLERVAAGFEYLGRRPD